MIVLYLISRLNLSEIEGIFLGANIYYLVTGLALTIVSAWAKAWRWNYLKETQGIKYSLTDSFVMYCASHLAGSITPGRVGEFSKIFYLKNDGHSYGRSTFGAIFDRLFDAVFLSVFSMIGMLLFFRLFQKEIPYALVLVITILIIAYLTIKTDLVKNTFLKIFNFLIPVKYQNSWHVNLQDLLNDLKNLSFQQYLAISALTIFAWSVYYLQMFILAKSLGISVPFMYLAVSVTVTGLVTMLPISYIGLGTRDAVLITLFSFFAISRELSVAYSTLILSTYIIMAVLGFICWLKKPLKLNPRSS